MNIAQSLLQIQLFSGSLAEAGLKIDCSKKNLAYLKCPHVSSRILILINFQILSLVQSPCEHIYSRNYHTREKADLVINELEHHIAIQQY